MTEFASPCPSRPYSPKPHVYSSPSLVMAALCELPAETSRINKDFNDSTSLGLSKFLQIEMYAIIIQIAERRHFFTKSFEADLNCMRANSVYVWGLGKNLNEKSESHGCTANGKHSSIGVVVSVGSNGKVVKGNLVYIICLNTFILTVCCHDLVFHLHLHPRKKVFPT